MGGGEAYPPVHPLFYYGIKNWKELPRNIRKCKKKDVFKTLVKQHLLDKGLSK